MEKINEELRDRVLELGLMKKKHEAHKKLLAAKIFPFSLSPCDLDCFGDK